MYVVENTKGTWTFLHMVKSAGTSIHTGIINASSTYDYKVHVNQRHASINNLPEKYNNSKKLIVLRKPEDWYKSFYTFFLKVEGYMSFMLHDPLAPDEDNIVYLEPLSIDEFVKRSINLKDTLMAYPNKARVFRNILRSQNNMHFITGYFEGDFSPEEPDTMQQFDCSLFEWFWRNVGGEDAQIIPMDRLDIVQDLLEIEIPHTNKTPELIDPNKSVMRQETIDLIRKTHHKFYEKYDNFKEEELLKDAINDPK